MLDLLFHPLMFLWSQDNWNCTTRTLCRLFRTLEPGYKTESNCGKPEDLPSFATRSKEMTLQDDAIKGNFFEVKLNSKVIRMSHDFLYTPREEIHVWTTLQRHEIPSLLQCPNLL